MFVSFFFKHTCSCFLITPCYFHLEAVLRFSTELDLYCTAFKASAGDDYLCVEKTSDGIGQEQVPPYPLSFSFYSHSLYI